MQNILASQTELETLRQRLEAIPDLNKVGLGWLRFSLSISYLDYWKERVKHYFRSELQSRSKGWNGYLESLEGLYSIIIAYSPVMTESERKDLGVVRSPNEGFMTVDIPQSALDSLATEDVLKFWLDVYGCEGLKITRVDNYYDDYCKLISPEEVYQLCRQGRVAIPRFMKMRDWNEFNLRKHRSDGQTIYFGSVKSDKQIRFYDKFAESEGRQNCYRWEVQLKGSMAVAFQDWFADILAEAVNAATLEESAEIIGNAYKQVIKGSISFHQVPEGKEISDLPRNWAARTPLTWWWKELLAGLDPAKLVVQRVQPSLAGTVEWIRHQVTPGLALLRTAFSYWRIPFKEWLDRELEDGEDRWKDRHWKMIQEALITSPAT